MPQPPLFLSSTPPIFAELSLEKHGQRWVFRYRPGQEPAILRAIAQAAANPSSDLDWHDAATLSKQLIRRVCDEPRPVGTKPA